jgi:hypothetical protein
MTFFYIITSTISKNLITNFLMNIKSLYLSTSNLILYFNFYNILNNECFKSNWKK